MTEGSDEYVLPITDQGVLRLKPRLLERYLDPDVDEVVVQATGFMLQVLIWSDRSNVSLHIPLDDYRAESAFKRSLHRNGVNLNRWLTPGKTTDPKEDVAWEHLGKIETQPGGRDHAKVVIVTVDTFDDIERPDNV